MDRLEAVDDKEISPEVKSNLQQYAYNVVQALTGKYEVLHKEVEEHMGGRVMQYSPVEAKMLKVADEVKKEKDAEYAKLALKLKELGRLDELFQASVDTEFRAKLMKELSIA